MYSISLIALRISGLPSATAYPLTVRKSPRRFPFCSRGRVSLIFGSGRRENFTMAANPNEIRVLHIVPSLFDANDGVLGGAERYALELARYMAEEVSTRLVTFGEHDRLERLGNL